MYIKLLRHLRSSGLLIFCFLFFTGWMTSSANADTTQIDRIYGSDRYATAAAISQKGWESSEYAVLARGDDFADALCAGPLAAKYHAPILLTESESLNVDARSEIQRLGVKRIFITGGTSGISAEIETTLREAGVTEIVRLAGNDRYETSVMIAEALNSNKMILATGQNYPDALSIAAVAAQAEIPILLAGKDKLPQSVNEYVQKQTIEQAYIVGGTGVISEGVAQQVPGAFRLAGSDRYATNAAVLAYFSGQLDFSRLFVAVGEGPKGTEFADALTGAVLAAKSSSPLILVRDTLPEVTQKYLKGKITPFTVVTGLGGENAVKFSVLQRIINLANTNDGELSVSPASTIAGATKNIYLVYLPGETLNNGTMEFFLPDKYLAIAGQDKITINGTMNALTPEQIFDAGQRVKISGLNVTTGQKIILTLNDKSVQDVGNYTFKVVADADGSGILRPSSGSLTESRTLPVRFPSLKVGIQLLSYNRPATPLSPKGFVIHSTADPGATAQKIVQYFNYPNRYSSTHYVADWTETVQMIPEDEVAWHAAQTANQRYLSVEMCEPEGNQPEQFKKVWDQTVLLVADACIRYGWDPQKDIFSHMDISYAYRETDHIDPIPFLKKYNKTWQDLLNAIQAKMVELQTN